MWTGLQTSTQWLPHLLQMVRQLVDLQYEELEGLLGGSGRVQEQTKFLLRDRRPTVEHFKRLGHSSEDPDHGPDELAGGEVLARVQDVGGLLRHGAWERAHGATLLQRAGGEFWVLEESAQEDAHLVHGSDRHLHLDSKQVRLRPHQLLELNLKEIIVNDHLMLTITN